MYFEYFQGLLQDCGLNRLTCTLFLIGVVLGDVWQIELANCQIFLLPLFLLLYLGVKSTGGSFQGVLVSVSISLLVGSLYLAWYLLIPLEPEFHFLNHAGWVGIGIGICAGAITRKKILWMGGIALGVLLGGILRLFFNRYFLYDLGLTPILSGQMRDEVVTAWLVAGGVHCIRMTAETMASLWKRKWGSIYSRGDVT